MVTRCQLPFLLILAKRGKDAAREAWKRLPEKCPHNDCSPGVDCRKACAQVARRK